MVFSVFIGFNWFFHLLKTKNFNPNHNFQYFLNHEKSNKNQLKPIKTEKTMVFSCFFQLFMKKPGFWFFQEKTEKTTNPDR